MIKFLFAYSKLEFEVLKAIYEEITVLFASSVALWVKISSSAFD